jgi:hypothetical protein
MGRTVYPMSVVRRARELKRARWTDIQTSRLIAEETEGRHTPARNTIRRWTDEDYRETERLRRETGKPIGGPRRKTWRMRFDRIVELHGLGISCASVAAVVCHDFAIAVSGEQVRRMLQGELKERTIKRLLWPQGARA